MSLFTLRCYLEQRFKLANEFVNKLEIWEVCIQKMLHISDQLPGNEDYHGKYNDKFHFLWETMILSLHGKTNIKLSEFYNCGCNGKGEDLWESIV